MERDSHRYSPTEDACRTTNSFADHDIEDGSVLVQRTYYRLVEADSGTFESTDAFYGRLDSAFLWAYLSVTNGTEVPDHVQASLDDAIAMTREAFDDSPDSDLRTEVLPTFYQQLAGFHCSYRS
jgi:hypothetical protein